MGRSTKAIHTLLVGQRRGCVWDKIRGPGGKGGAEMSG